MEHKIKGSNKNTNEMEIPVHLQITKKTFDCEICYKKFNQLGNLMNHKRTHTGEKPFSCEICSKSFTQIANLINHKRTHTGEKPYNCEICAKKFTQIANLINHKRTHTGEKPFSCEICSKKFTQIGNLNNHKRTHTGEKPFQCEICNKRFTQLSNLLNHKRIHKDEEKPIESDLFNKTFTELNKMIEFKQLHKGEKSFTCENPSIQTNDDPSAAKILRSGATISQQSRMAAATSVVVLDRGNNTTCTVNLHGATVVSWRVNNQEQLFVSKLAVFDGKKAIRGGIPFVFPQFGQWSYGPQHGFGRVTRWALERSPERLPSGDVEAVFSLMDNDYTRSMWNYPFRITYRLILREKELHFHIGVYNPSKEITFSFNLLLHTYLKVPDVRRCQITGLHGCTFIDKTRDGAIYQEGRDVVTVNEWTDRIYQHTPQEHIVTNVVSGRKMRIQKYNFPDTVIWNPWLDKAREMPDFGDDEYPNMLCVESGHVSSPVILLPGTAFEASQILQVSFVNGVSGGKPRRSKKNANQNNNNNNTNNNSSSSNNSNNNSNNSQNLHHHALANLAPAAHHHHHHHHLDANNLNILNNNHNFR